MDKSIDFHKDHKEWKSRLYFYRDEIGFFFKELNMVFDQNKENLARMELIDEYELILDKKLGKIEKLLNRIATAEKNLLKEGIDQNHASEHHQIHLDVLKFDRKYLTMKKSFKRFASHND